MDNKRNEAPPALVIRRVVKAKRDRVFEAWTNPEMMKDWFYCGEGRSNVSVDLKVGGSYKNEMIMKKGDCGSSSGEDAHLHYGEYLEIVPPEKIVFTWSSAIVTNSRVTIQLKDLGDSTEILLTHELLATEELRNQHTFGWEGCFSNLEKYFG